MTASNASKNEQELLTDAVAHLSRQITRLSNQAGVYIRLSKEAFQEMKEALEKHGKILESVDYVNKCVDETLCKVILAINQQAYLKAWYPEKDEEKG